MRNIYYKIKWAYQRITRGWDDTATWGLDSHFVEVVVPPLKELCISKLQDKRYIELNQERCKVYNKTLDLIEEYENRWLEEPTIAQWEKEDKDLENLATYFAKNIQLY